MSKTYAIIINGSGAHGKNSFVDFFREEFCKDPKNNVLEYSTVGKIKQVCKTAWGVDFREDKNDAKRNLWHEIKMAIDKYGDITNKEACDVVSSVDKSTKHANGKNVIFIMCREPEQIEKLTNKLSEIGVADNIMTMVIIRDGQEAPNCDVDSLDNIMKYDYDYAITAETLEELQIKAVAFSILLADF